MTVALIICEQDLFTCQCHHTRPTMETPRRNAFARALETFAADIRGNENPRNAFDVQILSMLDTMDCGDPLQQSRQSEEQLHQFIRDLDSRQRRTSMVRKASERLQPLVIGLSQFVTCCDVMIQAGQSPAVLIYGGARIVLQLAERFYNCFETVLSIMDDIGKHLSLYKLLDNAYQASDAMQNLLVDTYKNIISFWLKASRLLSRKPLKTWFHGIVKPLTNEWERCKRALEEDFVHLLGFAQATEANFRRQRDEERALSEQARKKERIANWIKSRDDDGLDIRPYLRQHLETRYEDTCEWLFTQPDVEKWLAAKTSTAIWFSAGPGAGKTIIASSLARKLEDDEKRVVAFFCSFNDVRKNPITVIRSIALQLLNACSSIPDAVQCMYNDDEKESFLTIKDIRKAVDVVKHFIMQESRIHIIIDGLDECEDRETLLSALSHLLQVKTYGIVKWFFSSRGDSDIRKALRDRAVIEVEAVEACLLNDIRRYLTSRLPCKDCVDRWTSLSNGNFLWMSHMLRIKDGETSTCTEELEEELADFPKGLTGCYARSLMHLLKSPEKHQKLAQKIFRMVVGAVQPLRLSELSHALAASKGREDYSERTLPRINIVENLCSNLIKFDRCDKGTDEDPLLQLTHKSVQDFFLQDPNALNLPDQRIKQFFVTAAAASLELGQSALSYLKLQPI